MPPRVFVLLVAAAALAKQRRRLRDDLAPYQCTADEAARAGALGPLADSSEPDRLWLQALVNASAARRSVALVTVGCNKAPGRAEPEARIVEGRPRPRSAAERGPYHGCPPRRARTRRARSNS